MVVSVSFNHGCIKRTGYSVGGGAPFTRRKNAQRLIKAKTERL